MIVGFNLQKFEIVPIDLMVKFNRVLRERKLLRCCRRFSRPSYAPFCGFQICVYFCQYNTGRCHCNLFLDGILPVSRFNGILEQT